MDPELEALGADLTRLGSTVVPHGDHLCVRLPFFASLRVRLRGGALRFEHRFGMASREIAVFSSTGLLAALSAGAFAMSGPRPAPFALAIVAVLSATFDIMRVVVTEAATTRVQMLWSARHPLVARGSAAEGPVAGAIAAPGTGALREGSGAELEIPARETIITHR